MDITDFMSYTMFSDVC